MLKFLWATRSLKKTNELVKVALLVKNMVSLI
jgi:hypothetical protein